MKVLHLLYQSYPNISGSSTRSMSIVGAQKEVGITPVVLTSPFQKGLADGVDQEVVNGITYYRCYDNNEKYELGSKKSTFVRIMKLLSILKYSFQILKVARKENVEIIHSHAMFYNAVPGIVVSFLLGIPHVYEIRSEWSKNSHFKSASFIKYIANYLEILSIKLSSAVVVISKGLYEKYSKYNDITTYIGNAVDDEAIKNNIKTEPPQNFEYLKIAYIGSVIELEGLQYVLHALSMLEKDVYFMKIVGDGESLVSLELLAEELGISANVSFTGKIPASEINKIYDSVDIIVNYRRDEPVSHSVTPLKPLEAMVHKKLIISSNVGGMTELIDHMVTGVVVPSDDVQALSDTFLSISKCADRFKSIPIAGYEYVSRNKTWSSNALCYKRLYLNLLTARGKR